MGSSKLFSRDGGCGKEPLDLEQPAIRKRVRCQCNRRRPRLQTLAVHEDRRSCRAPAAQPIFVVEDASIAPPALWVKIKVVQKQDIYGAGIQRTMRGGHRRRGQHCSGLHLVSSPVPGFRSFFPRLGASEEFMQSIMKSALKTPIMDRTRVLWPGTRQKAAEKRGQENGRTQCRVRA